MYLKENKLINSKGKGKKVIVKSFKGFYNYNFFTYKVNNKE
jgi:hypothetical protein